MGPHKTSPRVTHEPKSMDTHLPQQVSTALGMSTEPLSITGHCSEGTTLASFHLGVDAEAESRLTESDPPAQHRVGLESCYTGKLLRDWPTHDCRTHWSFTHRVTPRQPASEHGNGLVKVNGELAWGKHYKTVGCRPVGCSTLNLRPHVELSGIQGMDTGVAPLVITPVATEWLFSFCLCKSGLFRVRSPGSQRARSSPGNWQGATDLYITATARAPCSPGAGTDRYAVRSPC